MKRIACLSLIAVMVLMSGLAWAEVKNPDTFILAHSNTVITLDPGTCYSSTAWAKIMNIYETLIFFDGSSTEKFKPVLATDVPTKANGGISQDGTMYTFRIRPGVRFQNGNELTAQDVEYTFERALVVDQSGGPTWMLLEALFGIGSTRDKDGKMIPGMTEKIDQAITSDGDTVTFKLIRPFPPFLAILSYAHGSILDKEWAIEQGCWNGQWADAAQYNNPNIGDEPLHHVANGTGPYQLKSWEPGNQMTFERFDGYWGEKPKLKNAIVKVVKEWSTRKLLLKNGDVDRANVDAPYIPETKEMKNLEFYESPELGMYAGFFNRNIQPAGNPHIGSGKLDGQGIPVDFFADINVRRAFCHAFDRKMYKTDVFNDRVILPTSPVIEGLPFHKDVPIHDFNLGKAEAYMKKAFDGQVWEKGFKMNIVFFSGKETLEAAAVMLAENINLLNPKFMVEIIEISLKDFNAQYRQRLFPLFMTGWGADYPDPHNFAQPFMHSAGAYGSASGLADQEIDGLIQKGIETVEPEARKDIYYRIQELYYEKAVGLPLYQPTQFRAYRDWVKGYVPHPMLTDANEMFFNLSK